MNETAKDTVRIKIIHSFHLPAECVFDAWLDPGDLSRWMFGPDVRDERIVHLRNDPKIGGAFSFRVERGGKQIEHAGTYTAIERPRRLAFTWGAWIPGEIEDASSLVEIAIESRSDGCELTLTQTMPAEWADYAARTEQGWRHMLETMASALQRNDGVHGNLIIEDTIRFERLLPGPIERVWAYLTESDKRVLWLAEGPMALDVDGDIELHFRNAELSENDDRAPEKYRDYENSGSVFGRITRCEPPHRLSYTWTDLPGEADETDSEVCFELSTDGDGVRLVLTHRRLHAHELLSVAGGWHTHLGILEDRLTDRPPRPFWRTHTRMEAEYADRLLGPK
jgi:uncharacterized protein YndB with AHSA1/START domain